MAFIKRRDYLVNMLAALLLTIAADCLLAVPQSLLNMGERIYGGRGWGLGGNPLYLSGILCMVLPTALVIMLDPAFEKRLKKAASCAAAAITAGLIFNNSRSAWLTEVLVIPPTIWKYLKQQKNICWGLSWYCNKLIFIVFLSIIVTMGSFDLTLTTSPTYAS